MSKVRVGVIGVGHIGKNHARLYSEIESADFTAILDQDTETARKLADEYGAKAVSSVEEFCELVDAASVATPTTSHHAIGMQLLKNKKHILIEKPITEDTAQAKELIECAQANDLVLQVGHVERFNPVLGELEKMLTHPTFIESHRLSSYPNRSTDIGVVLDLMIHDLEIILHLVKSPVVSVDAVGVPVLSQSEDIANARIRFENGCVANVTVSRISPERMRKIRVFQDNAYLSLDYGDQSGEIFRKENGTINRSKVEIEPGEPLKRELEAFIDCAERGVRPAVSGQEAAAALSLCLEITEQINKEIKK